MISKLPKWVEFGGFYLAFLAGSVNAIGFLGFKHQAVSHLTGVSTLLGVELAEMQWRMSLHLGLIFLSFILGAALSGVLIGNATLALGRRYSVVLLIESLFLLLSAYLLNNGIDIGHFFASAACGLQNSMATSYSGASIRTTHVSGLFTDIGLMLGLRLRGIPVDRRKMILYSLLIIGFISGGSMGSMAYTLFDFSALYIPASMAALLAAIYWLYRKRQQR